MIFFFQFFYEHFSMKKLEIEKKYIFWDVIFWIIWVLKHILNTCFSYIFLNVCTNLHGNIVDTDERVIGVHGENLDMLFEIEG